MAKLESTTETKPPLNKESGSILDTARGAVTEAVSDFLENDPQAQITEASRALAGEATKFIQRNPWAAVLGAAAIGYYLGSTRTRSEPRR